MPEKQNTSRSVSLADTFHFLGIVGLVTVFCWYAKTIAVTFIISILFSFILNPAVTWIEKFHVRRWLAVLVVILVTLAIVLSLSYLFILRMQSFTQDWPKYQNKIKNTVIDLEKRWITFQKQTQDILPKSSPEESVREVKIQESSNWQEALSYLTEIVIHAALVPFLIYFILLDRQTIRQKIADLFGENNPESTTNALDQMQSQMIGFLSGNFVSILILWLITGIGFLIVGVDYAILNAAFFSVCNVIPVIGPIVGLIPPVLMVFLQTESFGKIAWVIAFGLLTHLIYANLLIPKLVGTRVQLNPVAIILALMYWGWIWGGTGLLLAIPLVACLKTICDHVEPWKPFGKLLS